MDLQPDALAPLTRSLLTLLSGWPVRILLATLLMFACSFLIATGHVKLVLVAALLAFVIPFSLVAPRAARLLAFAAMPLANILSVVSVAKPMSHNYFVYAALLSAGVLVAVHVGRPQRFSRMALYFGYLLVNAVVFIGVSHISSKYQTFIFPVADICYYQLAISSQRRELRIVVAGYLAFSGIEAALGFAQSLFNWPHFFFQQTFISPRNPLGFLLPSITLWPARGWEPLTISLHSVAFSCSCSHLRLFSSCVNGRACSDGDFSSSLVPVYLPRIRAVRGLAPS